MSVFLTTTSNVTSPAKPSTTLSLEYRVNGDLVAEPEMIIESVKRGVPVYAQSLMQALLTASLNHKEENGRPRKPSNRYRITFAIDEVPE